MLPTDSLLEVVGSLVTHDLISLRRKALDLLANKLQQLESGALGRPEVSTVLKPAIELLCVVGLNATVRKENHSDSSQRKELE